MGVVYKAVDTSLDRPVALKVLRKDRLSAESLAQLEAEASITASINHPHVVKVFTTGTDHGRFYIAMELVNKGTLDDLIRIQSRVAETQALEVAIQVADGLRAAQRAGLIHRDVKPGNILFADSHTAKIVDFGLAMLEQEAAEAAGSEIWGTPYYVAPEKLDQQPEDFRSDIYSLGATLFHALAGRPPFEAQDASMVALKHLKSQAVSLQAFAPWVSGSTAFVINRTLLKDPDERYQSYDELIEHLEYARDELAAHGGKPQEKKRLVLENEDDQKLWSYLTFGMIALCIVVGGGFYLYFHFHSSGKGRATLASASAGADSAHAAQFDAARKLLIAGNGDAAAEAFHALTQDHKTPAPLLQWCILHEGLSQLLGGHAAEGRATFQQLESQPYTSGDAAGQKLASFFQAIAKRASSDQLENVADTKEFSRTNFEAMGLLVLGLKDWALGHFDEAGALLREYASSTPAGDSLWIGEYRSLAGDYVADYTDYRGAIALVKSAKSSADIARIKGQVDKIKHDLRQGRALAKRIDEAMEATANLDAAQAHALEAARQEIATLCYAWNFEKAADVAKKLAADEAKARAEKAVIVRKIQWLSDFQKTLNADIAAPGASISLKRHDHKDLPGEPVSFLEKGVRMKSGETIAWKDVATDSVLDAAKALAKAKQDPDEAARRNWLAGIYALLIGGKTEAATLLTAAAQARPDYADALPLVFPSETANVAHGSKASASAQGKSNESPAQAIDDDIKTKWCVVQEPPQWLQLDLGKPQNIGRWTVKHAHAGTDAAAANTEDFSLQQSDDGKQWTDVDKVTGESSDITSRAVVPFTSRYVRLYITKPTHTGPGVRIFEFALYGSKEGPLPDLFAPSNGNPLPNLVGVNIGGSAPSTSTIDDSGEVFTINTTGADIWNEADACRYLYRPMNGNGEIVARIDSFEHSDGWAKAGPMFRENLSANSRNAYICVTPGNGVSFQVRKDNGGKSSSVIDHNFPLPCWVKLTRNGSEFTGFASADGQTWKRIGNTENVQMESKAFAGIATTSHNLHGSSTSKVDQVRIDPE